MTSLLALGRRFLFALQFLTVIQIWGRLRPTDEDLPRSMAFYPAIGVVLGVLVAWGHRLSLHIWPPMLADFQAILLMIVFTRALHLDGLGDTMDGLLGSHLPARSLEIMKDSSLGAFGVVSIVTILVWKFAALTAVPMRIKFETLCLLPILGRHTMVQLAKIAPYARSTGGLGKSFVDDLRWFDYAIAGITAVVACTFIAGRLGAILFGVIWIVTALESFIFRWRLGGVTGDVLGAASEFNEALVLVILAGAAYGAAGL
ncbi:MAG: adenosylcobinamide-GDP ribazoletransferase [Deltaproteobacteria bacterium]|nr:adenosylcobinamide-GDP ribazoletransferase [Deltaproteobacteria bacterium]